MGVKICDILELQQSHVLIKNVEELERKINKLVAGGKDNLHIIADFDCTLTKQRIENGKLLSSFGMFSECPSVPQKYKDEDRKLCSIYKPIENDPNLTIEEKTKHMIKWYTAANEILKGFHFPADELETVSKYVVQNLRDGVYDMFMMLYSKNVPVLVFSAGLGDAVVFVLKNSNILTSNVKVISNFLQIDENGFITGMKGDTTIHVFNKNETVIQGTDYYEKIKHKTNVLLLGDSLGDARMADGIDHSEAVIKIGFLFHNPEGNIPLYMDQFDIVLLDDQTVNIPNAILKLVLN